jgi:hypothetical protein
MYLRAAILCSAAAFLAVTVAPADDKPATEKPKAGLTKGAELPGPFRPFNVANGKFENKFHCPTTEHGLNPGVLIIAQNVDTGSAKVLRDLLRQLDEYAVEKPKTRLRSFAVFVYNDLADAVKDDDVREGYAEKLRAFKSAEPPLQSVVLCLDSAAALQKSGFDVQPNEKIKVVLFDNLKVTNVYNLTEDLADDKVKEIVTEVKTKLAPFKK